MGFKLNIVTKTKMSAKELSTTLITLNRSEVFNYGRKLYVPFSAVSVVFNSKGATKRFDKDLDSLVHPTKGKLFCLPKNVEQYVKVV
jgi:hypothetical protein